MTYSKPEIAVLGDAFRSIQSPPFKASGPSDSGTNGLVTISAYDLDE